MSAVVYALADTWISEFLYINRGEPFWADAAEVKAHPEFFSADPPADTVKGTRPPVVEQATAAPGEMRRGPGRPRKDA